MIAVATFALKKGKHLTEQEKTQTNKVKFSSKVGELRPGESSLFKAEISGAMRYIKAYGGPSRIWFAYQDSLTEGCNRLANILSQLPASRQTAGLIIKTLQSAALSKRRLIFFYNLPKPTLSVSKNLELSKKERHFL